MIESGDTLFIKKKYYDVREDGKLLGCNFTTEKQAKRHKFIMESQNPSKNYEVEDLSHDVEELKTRIVNFLEKMVLQKYAIETNEGKRLKKVFNYETTAQDYATSLGTGYKVVKAKELSPFPEYVSLDESDYELLLADGKVNKDKNTTFGMTIVVRVEEEKKERKKRWHN